MDTSVCQPAAPADDAEGTARHGSPRRAVDYLLAGTSVKTNHHLARFASAPYLHWLLNHPAYHGMFSRQSKSLRKEIIEAYAVLTVLESTLDPKAPPTVLIDLCSGKGFLATVLALEYPHAFVLQVDNNPQIKTDHVAALPNLEFLRADIMHEGFGAVLADALAMADGDRRCCMVIGMHLCGLLSPRAIELFGCQPELDGLCLVPCCLDKRSDGMLKAEAKRRGIDPYDAKVEELTTLLEAHAPGRVRVVRDATMRSGSGGVDGTKNVMIVAVPRHRRPPWHAAAACSVSIIAVALLLPSTAAQVRPLLSQCWRSVSVVGVVVSTWFVAAGLRNIRIQ